MRARRLRLTIALALALAGSLVVAPAGAGASQSTNPSAAGLSSAPSPVAVPRQPASPSAVPAPQPGPVAVPPRPPGSVAVRVAPSAPPSGPAAVLAAPSAPPSGPVAVRAAPSAPRVGQQVRLLALDLPSTATGYRWDLSGHGAVEVAGGSSPRTAAVFTIAGAHTVTVRVTTGDGVEVGSLVVEVRPAGSSRAAPGSAAFVPDAQGGATDSGRHTVPSPRAPTSSSAAPRPVAHTTRDPAVTIADFHFTPGATTVNVGDAITWTNAGPSSHSATASDGSFDTGVLSKGQSGSHTFTKSGTFSYFCKIHPFMHGTIVVLAKTAAATPAAGIGSSPPPASPGFAPTRAPASAPTAGSAVASTSSPTPTGAAASTSSPTPTGAAAGSAPALPVTGMDVNQAVAAGVLLIGAGLALRRGLRDLR